MVSKETLNLQNQMESMLDDEEVGDNLVSTTLDMVRNYNLTWGNAAVRHLPVRLTTLSDFEVFSQYTYDTMQVLDAIYLSMTNTPASAPNIFGRDNALVLFDLIDEIIGCVTKFWFMHMDDIENEDYLLRGDLPPKWLPIPQSCMCIYTIALVTSCLVSGSAYNDRSIAFTAIDVFRFPSVVQQNLVHVLKPIAEYSAVEVIWVLDALAHSWYQLDIDGAIMDYVHAIALRVGMFMRGGADIKEYEGTDADNIYIPYIKPSELHTTPTPAPNGSSENWCAPSQLFRDIIAARLGALIGTNWRASQYQTVGFAQYGTIVSTTARVRQRKPQTTPILSRPSTPTQQQLQQQRQQPQRLNTNIWNHLVPRKRPHPSATSQSQSQSPSPSPPSTPILYRPMARTPIRTEVSNILAKFDVRVAGIHVAKLLYRYATESATAETTRDMYATRLVESTQCPGDVSVFRACNRHRIASSSSTNVLKLLRGDRMTREILRRAKSIGPEPVLKQAILKHVECTQTQHNHIRSISTIEEEIAGLCVLDTLFRNRYGINWIDDYLVTSVNHQTHVSNGTIASETPTDTTTQSNTDNLYTHLPRAVMLRNTFDILYEGHMYRTHSFFETIAVWMVTILVVYNGQVPAPEETNPQMRQTTTAITLCDIKELCNIVTKGHESYVVRAKGSDQTQYNTITMGKTSISVISSV